MLKKSFVPFYLEGRDARLIKDTTDDKLLAEKVLAGEGDPRAVALAAAQAAAKPLEHGRIKTRWLHENEGEIRVAGGDKEEAYAHYMRGRVDSLAYSIEADILAQLGDMDGLVEVEVSDDDSDDEDDA